LARRNDYVSDISHEPQAKKAQSCILRIKSAANIMINIARCAVAAILMLIGCLFIMFSGLIEPESDDE
jgi:glycosylphosphatidylinositol transamidase (GPIT) subunit GPI8